MTFRVGQAVEIPITIAGSTVVPAVTITRPDGTTISPAVTGTVSPYRVTFTANAAGRWVWRATTTDGGVGEGSFYVAAAGELLYATPEDVRLTLGPLGSVLPVGLDVDEHVRLAHAGVLDRLRSTYGRDLPVFTGPGLDAIRWAEAKLAAASILSTLIMRLPEADRAGIVDLRTEAWTVLSDGVPGFTPGQTDPDGTGPALPLPSSVAYSSSSVRSLYVDPYDSRGPTVLLV